MNGQEKQELSEIVKLAIQNGILTCPMGKELEKRIRRIEFVMIALLLVVSGVSGYSAFFTG